MFSIHALQPNIKKPPEDSLCSSIPCLTNITFLPLFSRPPPTSTDPAAHSPYSDIIAVACVLGFSSIDPSVWTDSIPCTRLVLGLPTRSARTHNPL